MQLEARKIRGQMGDGSSLIILRLHLWLAKTERRVTNHAHRVKGHYLVLFIGDALTNGGGGSWVAS